MVARAAKAAKAIRVAMVARAVEVAAVVQPRRAAAAHPTCPTLAPIHETQVRRSIEMRAHRQATDSMQA
jgi:hypothetical protein